MAIGLLSKKNKEINKVVLVPLDEIHSNPNQPRRHFEEQGIRELAASIEENGLLQPVTLRKISQNNYELIAGERRTLAYKSLGEECIPAIVEEYSDGQSAVLALIENLQRRDLNYFEEALGIARLMNEQNLTQQQASEKLGKAQSTVANKLRLLKFSYSIQKLMLNKNLTERHARALLPLAGENGLSEVIEYVDEKKLNVEQTEEYVAGLIEAKNKKMSSGKRFIVKDMRLFTNSINKAVSMLNSAGIPAVSRRVETDLAIEYIINVPKK